MPTALVRALAAGLAVPMLLLSARVLPAYVEQGIYQAAMLLLAAAVFAEAAARHRVIGLRSRYSYVVIGFLGAVTLSYVWSSLDKYETSATALSRLLWAVPLYVAFLVSTHEKILGRILLTVAASAMAVTAWRTYQIEGDEWLRLGLAGATGIAVFAAGVLLKPADTPASIFKKAILTALTAALIVSLWAGSTRVRLAHTELDLVRLNRQTEHAEMLVARQMVRDHWALGAGLGSIHRKFLQHRPVWATLRGIPDRIPYPIHSIAVIVSETGQIGLLMFMALIVSPLFVSAAPAAPVERGAMFGLYAFFITHEILGGAWFLTHAGAIAFFCVLGLLLRKESPPEGKSFPTSFFMLCLMFLGGVLVIQQTFWWRTHQAEQMIRIVRGLIHAGRIDEAVLVGNDALIMDRRRTDIVSLMVGGMVNSNKTQRALENSQVILQIDPDYPGIKNNIGTFYVMLNQHREAVPYVKEVTDRNPTTESYSRLGHLYGMTGDWVFAKTAFSDALTIFPREIDIFMARTSTLPDSLAQGEAILQAAAFSAGNLLRINQKDPDPAHLKLLQDTYQPSRLRLKQALGQP